MKKIKVMTVIGTRPEIIRLSETIKKLDYSSVFDNYLVHTGQNYDYELSKIFFEDLQLREPNIYLNAAGKTNIETIAKIFTEIEKKIIKINPDVFLVLGDTNSALSSIVAKKYKIPIFHLEAGNRSFDLRIPEEINRKVIDHIADMNLPYSQIARENLLREGLSSDKIIVTGSPIKELINVHKNKINDSKILEKLELKREEYIVVSSHREENVDSIMKLKQLISSLNKVVKIYNKKIIFTVHPRTKKNLDKQKLIIDDAIKFIKPLNYTDFIKLQINAFVILSDSGTINEESSILGLKSLNIRESHERPEAVEEATTLLTGYDEDRILQGIELILEKLDFKITKDYDIDNFSNKILKTLLSYINYISKK